MGALRQPRVRFSFEAYLMLERGSETRSEFVDGFIYAMAGASPRHEAIVMNIGSTLRVALGNGPCRAYGSNLKVKTPSDQYCSYPDATVNCGIIQYHDAQRDVVTNPRVVFEILSPTTEEYDRGEKFLKYRELPSLLEYILLSQTEPRVEVRHREGDEWQITVVSGWDSSVSIPSLGCTVRLSDLYWRIFEDEEG